jgi:putative ABC transport system ATP-binding protein
MDATPAIVEARGLAWSWTPGTPALDIGAFTMARGEKVFLQGPSGSGKSTLLGLISGVLSPQGGTLQVLGHDLAAMDGARRDAFRAGHLGVIFQMFNLLPYLSVLDNVTLPCRFSRERARRITARGQTVEDEARRLLARLGLAPDALAWRSARALSVGQQQRVAVARALIGGPALIVADEPTSALDAETRDAFISLLIEECQAHGSSLLFVSHDAALAHHFDRTENLGTINAAWRGEAAA